MSLVSLALLCGLALQPVRVEGQCTLQPQGPIAFEPNPPGAVRPIFMTGGFKSSLALYQKGDSGPYRLLMHEAFGYSILDLTSPLNPTALYYHDFRFPVGGPNSVRLGGDGQSIISTTAVSADGQRAAFSLSGPAAPMQTVVGSADGGNGNGFTLRGDFFPDRAASTLIQHIDNRYIAYDIHLVQVSASDITTLPPSPLKVNNLNSVTEMAGPVAALGLPAAKWPGGSLGSLAGNYILYMLSGGSIQVIDASRPGPIGSITAAYPRTTITSEDFGGRAILSYSAAIDPADATKLWVLAQLKAQTGENSPSYGLLYVTSSLAKVSAGPIWRVPSQPGDAWSNVGAGFSLIPSNDSLFVLMWARRSLPSLLFQLYSTTAAAWGEVNSSAPPGVFDIPTALYSNFSASQPMRGFSEGNSVYAYIPTGNSAYVIPMTCVSLDVPATPSTGAADEDGAPLSSGDTRYYGDPVKYKLGVNPSPGSQPLTEYQWHVDTNFHAGAAFDDNGPGASPRLKAPDIAALGNQSTPPATVTVIGPCDPQAGGDPASGAGCWTSVTNNNTFGGPDFEGAPAAGSTKALTFAFEAKNALGSAGPSLFTLNWKAPAASIQSTQILSSQALVSTSDGHPTAYAWSFGLDAQNLQPSSCTPTASSCSPQAPFNTKGTYAYSLTAKYFADQAFTTTKTGTYTVTDFAPAFTVNGSANGPITAIINQSLNVVNSSQRGLEIAATYQYSLCEIPSGQTSCTGTPVSWGTMLDAPTSGTPPTSATIPVPATKGNYALKILVNYPGGPAIWPDPAPTAFFQLNVVDVLPLAVTVTPSPASAPAGTLVTFTCTATGGLQPYSYEWRSPIQFLVQGQTQQTYRTTSQVAGPLAAMCTVKDILPNSNPVSASAIATFTGSAPPPPPPPSSALSVNVSVNPTSATVNQTVTFSCNATRGAPPYTYQWRSPSTSTFVLPGSSQSFQTSSPTATTISAACTATDSAEVSGSGVAAVTITAPVAPPPTCANVNFQIKDAASGNLVALTGGLGIFTYSVRVGQPLSFEPTGTYSSYLWEFGDGETSTQAQAQHAYAAEGQRAVTLTVEGNSSCKKTYSVTAAGNSGAFTAAYEDSSSFGRFEVTAFKNIVFSALDLPSQVDSYAWEFSDGFTATIPNPAHAFSATAGTANVTHTVKLTVTREAQSVSTTQSFTVISPPEPPKWFVGGLAYATGSIEGTVWQTDVTILNPDPTLPATYSLAFLDGRKVVDPKDLVFKPVTLAAQQTMTSSNILGEFFEQPLGSFGALIVRGDVAPAPPTITSRTFNNGDPTKGSFGLSVPSTHTSNGGPPQGSAAPQLLIGLRDDDVAYTNIGLVNLISSDWSHAHLTFFDAAGATLGLLNVDVPPYGVAQLNKPLTSPDGLGLVSSALYRVQVTVEPGGSVYPYATVIDRKSTDPSIVTPADAPSNAYLIPGIVRQTGRNGERFRSRVTVSNTSDVVRTVRITLGYVRCDEGGCGNADTVVGDVRINPGQTQSWDDFVKVWLGHFKLTDVSDTEDYKNSYVDVRPVPEDAGTDPLIVLGETYNETPNGSTSSGRVGFQIPGYTPADGAGTAAANKRLVLTGLASTATYRTNIALFPVAGATGKWCNVHVYSQEGTKLRDIDVPVGAFTSVDNATLFGDLPGERFSIVIDNIDDGITLGGYATVIDNTSGDATFVKAQPAL